MQCLNISVLTNYYFGFKSLLTFELFITSLTPLSFLELRANNPIAQHTLNGFQEKASGSEICSDVGEVIKGVPSIFNQEIKSSVAKMQNNNYTFKDGVISNYTTSAYNRIIYRRIFSINIYLVFPFKFHQT